jgi:hypothetical protein
MRESPGDREEPNINELPTMAELPILLQALKMRPSGTVLSILAQSRDYSRILTEVQKAEIKADINVRNIIPTGRTNEIWYIYAITSK